MGVEEITDTEVQPEHETPPSESEAGSESAPDPEKDKLRKALKEANREAAARRKRLEELEAAEEQRKQSELSELDREKQAREKVEKELASERERVSGLLIKSAFEVEASRVGIAHPEDAYLLADKASIEVDENGKVTGVADAIKALVEAGRVPMLEGRRRAPDLDGGAGGGDRQTRKDGQLTPEQLEMAKKLGLSPETYAKQLKIEPVSKELKL